MASEDEYRVDPRRRDVPETGIFIRAKEGDAWGSHDLAHLDRDSVMRWLQRDDRMTRRVVLLLLGYEGDE